MNEDLSHFLYDRVPVPQEKDERALWAHFSGHAVDIGDFTHSDFLIAWAARHGLDDTKFGNLSFASLNTVALGIDYDLLDAAQAVGWVQVQVTSNCHRGIVELDGGSVEAVRGALRMILKDVRPLEVSIRITVGANPKTREAYCAKIYGTDLNRFVMGAALPDWGWKSSHRSEFQNVRAQSKKVA